MQKQQTMLESMLTFFISRKLLAVLFTVTVLLLGGVSLSQIHKNLYPDVEMDETIIQTILPGGSPKDIEMNITNKIEKSLKGVEGIKTNQSYSSNNQSSIRLELDPDQSNYELDNVRDMIRAAVSQVDDLPDNAKEPQITHVNTNMFPIIGISVVNDQYDRARADAKKLEKYLSRINEVSEIDFIGLLEKEFLIECDPQQLAAYDIPITLVQQKIMNARVNTSVGKLFKHETEQHIIINTDPNSIDALNNIVIRSSFEGPVIRLKDVARVSKQYKDNHRIFRMNGKQAVSLSLQKKESADLLKTIQEVNAVIEKEKINLSNDTQIILYEDTSMYMMNRLQVVFNNGVFGLCLVLISLAIFMKLRIAFWVALGIPISILATVIFLDLSGHTINILSTTAFIIILGIIVDDAIVVSENIYKKRQEGLSVIDAATTGTLEVIKPVFSTIITTSIAFIPMFFIPGVVGKFAYVIPLVVILALFISLFEVCFALPSHLTGVLAGVRALKSGQQSKFQVIKASFQQFVFRCLTFRKTLMSVLFLLFLLVFILGKETLQFKLFPNDGVDTIYIRCEYPQHYSLAKTSKAVKKVEYIVQNIDKSLLNSFKTESGFSDVQNRIMGANAFVDEHKITITLNLVPYAKRSTTAAEIIDQIKPQIQQLKDMIRFEIVLEEEGPSVGKPIEIVIANDDDRVRQRVSDAVAQILNQTAGVVDLTRSDDERMMQFNIVPNPQKMAQVSLSNEILVSQLALGLTGHDLFKIKEGDEDVHYHLIFNESSRQKGFLIDNLFVANDRNQFVKLNEVATITELEQPRSISHDHGVRTTEISARVDPMVATSYDVFVDIKEKINQLDLQSSQLIYRGEAKETQLQIRNIQISFFIALLGIYLVLIILFNSVLQPFIVIACVPLGVMGVILSFILHQKELSFFAGIGVIGLIGVLVNDALILLFRLNQLKKEQPEKSLIDIASAASADRLRAIFLTTCSSVLGIMPLAYGIGGVDPMLQPLAMALGYGLLFSTPFILFIVPALYLILDDVKKDCQKPFKFKVLFAILFKK